VRNPKTEIDYTGLYLGPIDNTYSGGCAYGCIDYASLSEAVTACNFIPTQCNAITFSAKQSGG
jgi:hypothetical protein